MQSNSFLDFYIYSDFLYYLLKPFIFNYLHKYQDQFAAQGTNSSPSKVHEKIPMDLGLSPKEESG